MSLYAMPPMNYAKKQEEVPSQTEVGTKEDLGKNVSAELAQDYKQVEERLDVAPTSKPAEQPEENRSVEALKNDIQSFREQIKIGETKDANGRYNEQLVLENEAKLREAEKKIASLNNQATISEQEEPTIEDANKPAVVTEKPKKKRGFFSRLFGFGKTEKE